LNAQYGIVPNQTDGMVAGWFMTCKEKGYTVFCLNYNDNPAGISLSATSTVTNILQEDYCLYVDEEKGEVSWYTA